MLWNIFRVATKTFKCFQIFSGLLQMPFLSQDQRKVCVHSWREGDRADVSRDYFMLRPKLSKLDNNCKSAKLCFWDLPVLVCTLPLPLNLQILEKLLHSGKLLCSYLLKYEKSKMRGRKKNYLQIVEKLLNSGTLAVSSCTNLALIKTAASLENTFFYKTSKNEKSCGNLEELKIVCNLWYFIGQQC